MPVTRGGAREFITESPAIKAIQEAGDALGRMGQLFNQTRQVRAYEKQISMENAGRFMEQAQNVFARYAEATDPARAWNDLGGMLQAGLAAYGIDAGEVSNAFRQIGQIPLENMNPMTLLSRAWSRSQTGKGLPFDQAVGQVIGEEQQRLQKEEAAASGGVGKEPTAKATPPPPLQQPEGLHVRYGQLEPEAAPTSAAPAPPAVPAVPSAPIAPGTLQLGETIRRGLTGVRTGLSDLITANATPQEMASLQAALKKESLAGTFRLPKEYTDIVWRLYREGKISDEHMWGFPLEEKK